MLAITNFVIFDFSQPVHPLFSTRLIKSFPLTSAEQSVLARGRNANLTARKKGAPTSASVYQDSTAFEALLGYVYISNKERFIEMVRWMKLELDELDTT